MASKRIILLLDGTWNDQDVGSTDTNIVRMQQIIASSLVKKGASLAKVSGNSDRTHKLVRGFISEGDRENLVFYERGVGTGAFDRFSGGIFGDGLSGNVRRAYKFLSYWYEKGDQVFIFGFSRGAFTARSLVGYIAAAGLLTREQCSFENEKLAWGYYRTAPNDRLPGVWAQLEPFVHERDKLQIDCVGVFDTVGALGVPIRAFEIANRDRYSFHDVNLSSITRVNLHAVAIDEHRAPFQATLWRKPKFKQFASHTEQVWFPGAHADVGGSYIDETTRKAEHPQALDDVTLDWMLKRVQFYFPDFPTDPTAWTATDNLWALAQQHEARQFFYRIEPFSLRSIANYAVTGLGFGQRNVSQDRHADPIGEMVHVCALDRIGAKVKISDKSAAYAPINLLQVLQTIEATYRLKHDRQTELDILVVDWTGNILNPKHSHEQSIVLKSIAEARTRLS
jgi:hypothetical protein